MMNPSDENSLQSNESTSGLQNFKANWVRSTVN